jgi:hypothetical protein
LQHQELLYASKLVYRSVLALLAASKQQMHMLDVVLLHVCQISKRHLCDHLGQADLRIVVNSSSLTDSNIYSVISWVSSSVLSRAGRPQRQQQHFGKHLVEESAPTIRQHEARKAHKTG